MKVLLCAKKVCRGCYPVGRNSRLNLYGRLEELCSWWLGLGKPGLAEFDLEFVPEGHSLPEREKDTWVIPRKFTVEIVRLRPKPEHNAGPDIEAR
ncbi:MAG: hypothetical protein ACP5JD_05675 [Candidatus Bipolaricaulaceae bacterium]